MAKKQMTLEVVNSNAAGIDVGSRSHWVSVGQNSQDVKEFGVYSEDHHSLCEWLKKHKVTTIAMESTGTYWQNLFSSLVAYGLDVVVNDIVGLTGVKIITSFINGEKSGKELAKHRHYNCKKPETEIAKALEYNGREDYYFALQHEWKTYLHLQTQIDEVDVQIKKHLTDVIDKDDNKKQHIASKKTHKRKNKNTIRGTDMNQMSYQYFEGIDLMAIEGVNDATIMAIISEIGLEGIKKFETAKQFTSWLRLAPNNKISGGKVLSHHLPKGSNRLKIALRQAANAIGNLKEGHLSDFFRRINYKRGRATAVSATARKLAVIIWNMLVKGVPYNPPTEYLFLDQKRKMKLVSRIKKQIAKFELNPEDVGFDKMLNISV